MTKIAFITDSTAYVPEEMVRANKILVVPLKLHWDGEVYKENVDITPQVFYERLEKSESIPST
ncbi:MAG: DegV family protein, partial [Pelolinea sp.]|nr:DegV family protein [Pelolinea sp.]